MKNIKMKKGCEEFMEALPDLVMTPGAMPSVATRAHLRICPPCAEEYRAFQRTFGVLDSWMAPELSPYFDQKMAVRVREEQAAPRMGWLERMTTRMSLNTGRGFRPALAGALALVLVAAGGGSYMGLSGTFAGQQAPQASATVNDLQILDRNEQALQQLDELQQDDDTAPADAQLPSS